MAALSRVSNSIAIFLLFRSFSLINAFHNPINTYILSKTAQRAFSNQPLPLHIFFQLKENDLLQRQFAKQKGVFIGAPSNLPKPSITILKNNENDNNENIDSSSLIMTESDQSLLGIFGTFAGFVTLYSEFTLKTTGCGLPAGPFGLVGAVEGISYLIVVGIAAFATYTKIKAVSHFSFSMYSQN